MAGHGPRRGPNWTPGAARALRRWSARQDETAIFSHFVAINSLVGLLTGDDRVVIFRPAHCSITRLVRKGGTLAVAELGSEAASIVT